MPVRGAAVWPGRPPGLVTASFEGARFYVQPMTYQGPWAWFRMIDATGEAPDGQQRVRLNVQNGPHRAVVVVEAARATNNPFATRGWRQFSCES